MGKSLEWNKVMIKGLRFIIVKGAWHYVTEDQPKVSKALLDKFLEFNSYKTNDDDDGDSFPFWAIIIIIVCGLMIIIVVGFLIIRKRRNKSAKEFEEKIKLVSDIQNELK